MERALLSPAPTDPVPAGFARAAGSRLIVPVSEPTREVWTDAEWRAVDRASRAVAARGVRLVLVCEVCRSQVRQVRRPGRMVLSCDHAQRECRGVK